MAARATTPFLERQPRNLTPEETAQLYARFGIDPTAPRRTGRVRRLGGQPGATVLGGQRGGQATAPTTPADWETWFRALVEGKTPSLETLESLVPQLTAVGAGLEYNARRTGADLRLPDGTIVDVVVGLENPDVSARSWSFQLPEGAGAGGAGGGRRSDDATSTGDAAVSRDELFALGGRGYAAAVAAARRQRARAGVGGRQGTILGGFGGGRPTTRPTVLGGY
jgi:hypothetical protein